MSVLLRMLAGESDGAGMIAYSSSVVPYLRLAGIAGLGYVSLPDPAQQPASPTEYGEYGSISWSADGQWLACGTRYDGVAVYQRGSGAALSLLPALPDLPAGSIAGTSWTPNGSHLAVSVIVAPFNPVVVVYSRSGTTFTKLPDIPAPTVAPLSLKFSPNGDFLAVANIANGNINLSPYVEIYSRSGDTFTKLGGMPVLSWPNDYSIAWSPDSTYLAIAAGPQDVGAGFSVWKRSGTSFSSVANMSPFGGFTGAMAWSPDSGLLVLTANVSPFIKIYQRSGDSFVLLGTPNWSGFTPSAIGHAAQFTADGKYFICDGLLFAVIDSSLIFAGGGVALSSYNDSFSISNF